MTDSLQYAMTMRDTDISKPSRYSPASITSQIAALQVQDSCCVCEQLSADMLSNLGAAKKVLSDGAYSCMRSAKKRAGMADCQFTIESAVTIASSGRIFVLAIITRTA